MKTKSTNNNILLLIYNEIESDKILNIKNSIRIDNDLLSEYRILKKIKNKLDNILFSPKEETIQKISSYYNEKK